MSERSYYSSAGMMYVTDRSQEEEEEETWWVEEREREREERRERVCVVGGKGQAKHNEIPPKRASESTKTLLKFLLFKKLMFSHFLNFFCLLAGSAP
jgi:hypothetical protein